MAQNIISNVMSSLSLNSTGKKALVLGSGFVSQQLIDAIGNCHADRFQVCKPTVQLLSDNGVAVTVACRTQKNAEHLCEGIKNTRALSLDVNNTTDLDTAIAAHDVVISLIPYTYHATVMKSAIKNKKNMVTTSYVSDALKALEGEAKEAGITVMNEIGVDPGIDHLYAVEMIDRVHKQGGKINGFWSYCGGLTAPENSDNPLGYKFSWSSRGVLLALRNTAVYFKDGKREETPGHELMASAVPYETGFPGFNFYAYPNRDSTPYRERYNIPEAQTIIRGTLRYLGFTDMIKAIVDMGFLSEEPLDVLADKGSNAPTWAEATKQVLSATSTSENDLTWAISSKTKFPDTATKERVMAGLKWIGMFSDAEKIHPRGNPLDTLCATLERKMQYEEGERDFLFLQHKFDIEWKDGKKETKTATLVEYGAPIGSGKPTAMAKLVGVPCGVATLMVLDGRISEKGVLAPMNIELVKPIMDELEKSHGIHMKERTML